MRASFATIGDPLDAAPRSGIKCANAIAMALTQQGVELEYIGPLSDPLTLPRRALGRLLRVAGLGGYLTDRSRLMCRGFARQIAKRIDPARTDVVLSTGVMPLAYLDVPVPMAFWTDATWPAMLDYYPGYCGLRRHAIALGDSIERRALDRISLAIFTSEWAAEHAAATYGVDPDRLAVVPFGPNLDELPARDEVERAIEERDPEKCRLLFIGVDWERKGGDIAVEAVNSLNDRGIPAELAVVGTIPPSIHLPEHVTAHGFISKHTSAGQVRLKQLLRSAHFLIHPARAEACAVVFSEASAFGVPSVASATGGISSAVRPGRNGFLLPTSAVGADYADVIEEAFADQKAYRRLAASAFETYLNHLNWRVSGAAVAERLGAAVTQWRSSHPGTSGSGRSRMVSLPRLA